VALDAVADEWFALQLESKEHTGVVRGVRREPPEPVEVAGHQGLSYRAAFESVGTDGPGTDYLLRLFVFAQGEIACTVVLLAPASRYERYRPIFEQMLASIRLTEPRFLRQARAAVLLDPRDLDAGLRLGEAWQRTGAVDRAARAFERVLAADASSRPARLSLARLWVDLPTRQEEGARLLEQLLEESEAREERVELLLLAVRYDLQAGREARAWKRIETLMVLAPGDPRVERLARALPTAPRRDDGAAP